MYLDVRSRSWANIQTWNGKRLPWLLVLWLYVDLAFSPENAVNYMPSATFIYYFVTFFLLSDLSWTPGAFYLPTPPLAHRQFVIFSRSVWTAKTLQKSIPRTKIPRELPTYGTGFSLIIENNWRYFIQRVNCPLFLSWRKQWSFDSAGKSLIYIFGSALEGNFYLFLPTVRCQQNWLFPSWESIFT